MTHLTVQDVIDAIDAQFAAVDPREVSYPGSYDDLGREHHDSHVNALACRNSRLTTALHDYLPAAVRQAIIDTHDAVDGIGLLKAIAQGIPHDFIAGRIRAQTQPNIVALRPERVPGEPRARRIG